MHHLDFLDASWRLHVQDGGRLVGVSFNTLLSDQIAQELLRGHSKGAFFGIDSDLVLPEAVNAPRKCFT